MKIWHISDTHTFENSLGIPEGIDMVIFSGDCSNPRDLLINEREVRNFISWFKSLPIKYKIFIAGNHDLSIEKRRVTPENFTNNGITYLENNSTTIEGLKIWGSPITPNFGEGWAFNKDRAKMDALWSNIPEYTDIVVTHGPAMGVLDLSLDRNGNLEMCGCRSLLRHIRRVNPKLFCFGHIHSAKGIDNAGYTVLSGSHTIYSNGSLVMDGKFDYGAVYNGNIFEI